MTSARQDAEVRDPVTRAEAPQRREGAGVVRTVAERYGVVIAWIVVVIVFSVLRPDTFATSSTVRLILSTQTVVLLATLGLMLSLAVAEYDLSIGAVVGFGGTLMAVLNGVHGWSAGAAVLATLVVCLLFGLLNAVVSVYVGVQSIIVTLGTGTVLSGITLAVADSRVVTGISRSVVTVMTDPLLFGIPAPFFGGLLLCAGLWFLLQHTPLGRRMVFVSENREVARLAGLRVKRIRAGALVATATLGGLAGIVLAGTNGAANPQAGSSYLLPAFAAAFLGSTAIIPGRFNAWGSFVAVYFLVTGITGLQYLGYAGWPEQVFYGSSLVIAVTLSHLAGRRRMSGLL
jgi:ribose transport system permease protein